VASSGLDAWLVFDFSCAPGWADSVDCGGADGRVSVVSCFSCFGGAGALGLGVVLQAANPSPTQMAAINIKDFILANDVIECCHQK
jgi:hypothetical protein